MQALEVGLVYAYHYPDDRH